MREIRRARLGDLDPVASWLRSQADCERWAGSRVSFPIDLARLPESIQWRESESWSLLSHGGLSAFGQLVSKPANRAHLARLIVSPERRGEGLGRFLSSHLIEAALSKQTDSISLNVARENRPALHLYRSLGFAEARRPADEPGSESVYLALPL